MNSDLKQFGITVLRDVHTNYLKLVKDGSALYNVNKNQFGEMAMQIDITSEEVVIKHLQILSDKFKKAIKVVSEEHGEFVIGDKPEFTAFLDGFDGSSAYRDSRGQARGGTMVAIYKGVNPRFQDYLFGGIADLIMGELVVAVKGAGTLLVAGDKISPARVSKSKVLDDTTHIDIDEGIENYPLFKLREQGYFYDPIKKSFKTRYLGSSAVYFFDLATGRTDVVLEYGRKNNLEHMVAYPVILESNGVVEFVASGDLGPIRYNDYCVMEDGHPAIIAASTSVLAEAVRRYH